MNKNFIIPLGGIVFAAFLGGCRDNPTFVHNVAQPGYNETIDSTKIIVATVEGVQASIVVVTPSDTQTVTLPEDTSVVYERGQVLSYSFSLKQGYSDLRAFMGNESTPVSGYLNDSWGVLWGSSDKEVVLPSDAQTLLTKWSSLTSRNDSVAAYREIMDINTALVNTYGEDAAKDILEKSFYLALSPQGADSVSHYISNLPDSIFFSSTASTSLRRATVLNRGMSSTASSIYRQTSVVMINGVTLGPDFHLREFRELRNMMNQIDGISHHSPAYDSTYINSTASSDSLNHRLCYHVIRKSRVLGLGPDNYLDQAVCYSTDLVEAGRQIYNVLTGASFSVTAESQALADRLEMLLDRGDKVIVVGESQGALITQEAFKVLYNRRPDKYQQTAACLGAVAVASPVSGFPMMNYSEGSEYFGYVTIKDNITEDVVRLLGLNTDASGLVSTDSSMAADKRMSKRWWLKNIATRPVYNSLLLAEDTKLHMWFGSYNTSPETTGRIKTLIEQHLANMETTCRGPAQELIVPDTVKLVVAQQKQINIQVLDARGKNINGYTVSFTQPNSNIVTFYSGTNYVLGKGVGSTTMTFSATINGVVQTKTVHIVVGEPTVQITPTTIPKLTIGYTHVTLTAKVFDADGQEIPTPPISWTRQNTNVGLANPHSYSTLVQAWEAGGSYVYAYYPYGGKDSVFVPTERATVQINPATVPKLTVGYTHVTLTAKVFDANGQEIATPAVQWARQNSNVGFSNQYSYTTAVSAGGAGGSYVHAYGQHGGQDSVFVSTATATVQIIPSTVPTLTVGTSSNSVIFTAKVFDANGQEIPTPPVQWARQNTNISFNNQYSATTSVIAQAPGGSYAHAYYAYGGQDSVYVPTQAH